MTTHILNLTDGTTPQTVNLASNYADLLEYVPRSPDLSSVDFTPETLRDGGERPITTRRNVTESAKVRLHPTDTATTNYVLNPSGEIAGNFAAETGTTVTRSTTYAKFGSYSYRVQTDANAEGINLTLSTLANAAHYVSFWFRDTLPTNGFTVYLGAWKTPTLLETVGSWYRYGIDFSAAQANGQSSVVIAQSGAGSGDFFVEGVQVEQGTAATAYVDGDQGPLYSWSGTAHGSTSSRTGTTDSLRALVRVMERLFQQAQHRQRTGLGTRVYVKFDPGNSGTVYRSEVLSGRVDLADAWALTQNWEVNETECLVTWTRRYYWEADSETELSLSNGGGSGTGGQTVYNHDDGDAGHDNYVAIASGAVAGAIPAPLRLTVYNNFSGGGGTIWPTKLYIAHNVFSTPGSLSHIIEGESAATGGTNTAGTTYSNGTARNTGLPATEGELMKWSMGSVQAAYCAGNHFRVLARFGSAIPANSKYRVRVSGVATTDVQDGPLFNFNTTDEIADLGVVRIPGWTPTDAGGTPFPPDIYLRGYGTGTITLDYLQLSPVDSYRYVGEFSLLNDDKWVDDGILDQFYVVRGTAYGSGRFSGVPRKGGPIHVWPNRDQRIYFLAQHTGSTAMITATLQIQAYYRPRRLTF